MTLLCFVIHDTWTKIQKLYPYINGPLLMLEQIGYFLFFLEQLIC